MTIQFLLVVASAACLSFVAGYIAQDFWFRPEVCEQYSYHKTGSFLATCVILLLALCISTGLGWISTRDNVALAVLIAVIVVAYLGGYQLRTNRYRKGSEKDWRRAAVYMMRQERIRAVGNENDYDFRGRYEECLEHVLACPRYLPERVKHMQPAEQAVYVALMGSPFNLTELSVWSDLYNLRAKKQPAKTLVIG